MLHSWYKWFYFSEDDPIDHSGLVTLNFVYNGVFPQLRSLDQFTALHLPWCRSCLTPMWDSSVWWFFQQPKWKGEVNGDLKSPCCCGPTYLSTPQSTTADYYILNGRKRSAKMIKLGKPRCWECLDYQCGSVITTKECKDLLDAHKRRNSKWTFCTGSVSGIMRNSYSSWSRWDLSPSHLW